MKHTKLPWEYNDVLDNKFSGNSFGIHGDGWVIAEITPIGTEEDEANAEFIVKAVNNHYQLLDALKDLMSSSGGGKKSCGHDFTCSCAWDKAKKAIRETEL